MASQLTFEQAKAVLRRFKDLDHRIVLVGGQALNFWVAQYLPTTPALRAGGPYTSKDIDFLGSMDAVVECAARLGGEALLATIDDAHSPSTGAVVFVDAEHVTRQIDFLGVLHGVPDRDLERTVTATVEDVSFEVINPIVCLKSRAANVAFLEAYQNDHGRDQLRAAIICAKQYAQRYLEEGAWRDTLDCNEEVFALAEYKAGPILSVRDGIDVMEAVVEDARLPTPFLIERLPRARSRVDRARARCSAAQERSARFASSHNRSSSEG